MSNIIAVVVTHNRKDLLLQNIKCLLKQEVKTDILVVDNLSTDGTFNELRGYIKSKKIIYYPTKRNLGGAGGFSAGILEACKLGYDYLWLMDDDCMPCPKSLSMLINYAHYLNNEFGFLSSQVLWKNNALSKMNIQKKTPFTKNTDFHSSLVKIQMATFVSLLIKSSTIKRVGLPIKEFFIWADDLEYTRRISVLYPCYLVNSSKVKHNTPLNIGSNIALDEACNLNRYKYAYRNEVYVYKREGILGMFYIIIRLIDHLLRIIFKSRDNKIKRLNIILKSTLHGITFNPKINKI